MLAHASTINFVGKMTDRKRKLIFVILFLMKAPHKLFIPILIKACKKITRRTALALFSNFKYTLNVQQDFSKNDVELYTIN